MFTKKTKEQYDNEIALLKHEIADLREIIKTQELIKLRAENQRLKEKEQLISKVKFKLQDVAYLQEEDAILVKEYTDSNRVKTLKIGNIELAGVEVRTILGLRSTNFTFVVEGNNIKFSVTGYGHGVGMSQWGANGMAKKGCKYYDILFHYFKNTDIKDIY